MPASPKHLKEHKIQFIHGLEGSPRGNKARLLAQHFTACTPAMETSNFESCVDLQSATLTRFRPDLLVGSSFGGAVALAMLQRGLWRGRTLLLAQAGLRYGLPPTLPAGVRVWIVHGRGDDIIDPEDSSRLAASGQPDLVRLIEVDDNHALTVSMASGALVDWVIAMLSLPAVAAARS